MEKKLICNGTSENDAEKMLRLCAEDPMWAAHAEVSKSLLVRSADELAALRSESQRLRSLLCEAINMGENWPGIAYTDDLKARCRAALPGWEPDYGW